VASHDDILVQVQRANERFYRAFESLDLRLMAAVWVHADRARCVHPGWELLEGWPAIRDSWEAIFANTDYMRFVITDVSVHSDGHLAWVTCTENLSDAPGSRAVTHILATNIYELSDDDWLLVHHHASPILRPAPRREDPELEEFN
jgi:ketosteroid isomerase-like protein